MPPDLTDLRALVSVQNRQPVSQREQRRKDARERREERLRRRRAMFEAVVGGETYEEAAARFGVHIATVRREVDLALAARAPDSADRYVALQMARLHKALKVVNLAMDEGNLAAVAALATLNGQFDRYHGVAALLAARPRSVPALHDSTLKALESPDR